MSPTFGSRLRYERERRQIALKSIAESTKIGMPLLEGLERDDLSRWPSGIFRKSFIRSYAEAIGVNADAVVREFIELYPDPLQAHTTKQDSTTPQSSSPLSIKLTITWSGSVNHVIERFSESKIGRLLRSSRRVFSAAAPGPVRPA
jgi:cytoskeletal protein RodZ